MHSAQTYYHATATPQPTRPPLEGTVEVDTVIIGGGFAGLMTQIGLLERGHRDVALVEKQQLGWGASGRNGGFVFGGYSLSPRDLIRQVGPADARELYQLTVAAVERIRQRVQTYAIDCDLVDEGVLWVNWFKDPRLLSDEQALLAEQLGVNWQYLPQNEVQSLLNSERYHGALKENNAMHFHPLNYALGIAAAIERLGGQIYQHSPALSIDALPQGYRIRTPKGELRCRQVVVAAGGYIEKFYPKIARAILPIATYVMATEPLDADCNGHIFTDAAVYDTRFAFDYYRKLKDQRLLWGGRISALSHNPARLERLLRHDLQQVFPALAEVPIAFVWDGWMGYTRHKMPCIGRLQNGIWYNLGFGGHGVGPTTAGGELIAAAIAEGDDRYRLFHRWGLPWAGDRAGRLAAQATYWWYQSQDWLRARRQ